MTLRYINAHNAPLIVYILENVCLGLPLLAPDHPAPGPGLPDLLHLHDDVPLGGEVPGGHQLPASGA